MDVIVVRLTNTTPLNFRLRVILSCSVCWSDTWCKGKAAESERTSAHANQSAAYYNEEDSVWWRVKNMGSVPDAHPQASYRPAQSFRDCQADCILTIFVFVVK